MTDRVVSYIFRGSFTSLNAGLATAGRNVGELGTKLTALDKNGAKMRAGLTTLGGTAGKIGLVAAAGLGAVVAVAARFDKAMSAVDAATHETAGNMELLRQAAIKAGADTSFSASEAAQGIEELAKAGVSTKDILAGGLTGALNLAAAGAIGVGDAAELAATAMTQFKLGGDQMNHVADLLAAGAGKAQGGVDDLGMALKQGGLVAAQTGLSIEETTGALAEFAANGLIGSDAGTSFKTMLQALTPNSQKAADKMAELGLSAYDAQGNFVGMSNFAGQLQESLGKLSVEQQNAALKTIFGSDAVRAASIIFKDGAQGVEEWQGKVDDAGYAAETAGKRLDNLSGDWEKFTGSLETALIGAGEGSQGPLRKLVQGATDAVNAFNKLPAAGQNAATGLLAVTAIIGGGLWFTSKTITGISNTKAALDGLGISASKAGGRLARIGASSGTIFVAAQAIGMLVNATTDLGNAVNSADVARDLEAIGSGATTDSLSKLSSALEGVNEAGAGTVNALFAIPSALTGIKTDFATSKETIEQFDQQLASLVESGNAEQAAADFKAIRDAAAAHGGVSDSDVVASFDAYKTALGNVATAAQGAGAATGDAGEAAQGYGVKARKAAQSTSLLNDEIRKSREAAKTTATAFVGLGDSLNDGKKSLGEWIASLQKQSDALRNFRMNAAEAADKGLRQGLIKALQEAGPEGALRMKQLANATKDEIAKANGAWESGQKQVKLYTDAIGGVPTKIHTDVDISTAEAMRSVKQVRAMLASLPDAVHTNYFINTIRTGTKPELHAPAGADGMTVPGARHPYGDKTLIFAAPGEEVITNRHGEADRFRADRAAGRIPGYALGGTVGLAAGGMVGSVDRRNHSGDLLWGLSNEAFAAAFSLAGLSKMGEKEVKQREKFLDRESEMAQKSLDIAKQRLDSELGALKDLKAARADFANSVSSNFKSAIFGNVDLASAGSSGLLGQDFKDAVWAYADKQRMDAFNNGTAAPDQASFQDWVQSYLETLSQTQLTALQVTANTGQLNQDTTQAGAFDYVLNQLRDMGLTGGAFRELAQSGNLAQAQAYANLSPEAIAQLVADYKERKRALNHLGSTQGDAEFGRAIRQQTRVVEKQRDLTVEIRDQSRELNKLSRSIDRRLAEIQKIEARQAKDTGKAVGDAVNNAVTHGQRKP